MCKSRDMRLVLFLKELVADYNPSTHVLTRMMEPPKAMSAAAGSSGVRSHRLNRNAASLKIFEPNNF